MQLSSETLQNLPYFWNKKTQIFFAYYSEQLWICISGYTGLYQHRIGHQLLQIQRCSK